MKEDHIQLKAKCLACNLHFIVCSWYPGKHDKDTLYCPECGQHEGAFLTWSESVAEPVCAAVPGQAAMTPDWLENATLCKVPLADLAKHCEDSDEQADV